MKILIKLAAVPVFFLYIAILTKLILFKYHSFEQIMRLDIQSPAWIHHNFVPFKTINFYLFLANINVNSRIENLAGNLYGFIPFGLLLPLFFKKMRSLSSVVLATFLLSLAYELIQLVYRLGSFDVDDLILNTAGGVFGYAAFKIGNFIWNVFFQKA